LPTRVVDVGLLNDANVKLHMSNGELGHWLALSHCWGGKSASATTKDNLNARCHGFPISELSRTFRDAVMITRKLGHKYLWIDCLCIIQDCDEDWQIESVKMAEIYSHGLLTISADAAINSDHGIFRSANTVKSSGLPRHSSRNSVSLELPVHGSTHNINTTLYARRARAHHCPDDVSILQKRAWAFQEAVLSRRRIRYTPYGILWSCTTSPVFCDEQLPHYLQQTGGINRINSIFKVPHQTIPSNCSYAQSPGAWQAMNWWYEQINSYASRLLSFESDRLLAISGLAKMFAFRTGCHYYAGIWAEDFRRGLLWNSEGQRVGWDHSPSWSWAAIQ
ncbi:HET-domain-containing protein, partial [Acephala macrosclerotiorum]